MKQITSVLLLTLIFLALSMQQMSVFAQSLTDDEKFALKKAIESDSAYAKTISSLKNEEESYTNFKIYLAKDDTLWKSDQARLQKIKDFGYTSKFELIPVIDSLQGTPGFIGGGLSYLIRTDNTTILFDTGYGPDTLDRCSFRYNLDQLHIDINEINAVFISHNHADHQNLWKWISNSSFKNKEGNNILSNIKVYVPEDVKNLKIPSISSHDPIKIAEGVYSTGIIREPTFKLGQIREQSLMFNVKDKGIIIVVGCGHQSLEKLIHRVVKLSDTNIYGIIGGLHMPFLNDKPFDDKFKFMGYTLTGKLPWNPLTNEEVNQNIELLKDQRIRIIGLSPHDSSVRTLTAFRNAFPKEYINLKIGRPIEIE